MAEKKSFQERAQSHESELKDQIEYIADLLLELRDMARQNDLTTLAGILDLARTEARRRAKELA